MATATQSVGHRDPVNHWVPAGIVTGLILAIATIPLQSASEMRENGAFIGTPTYLGGVIHDLVITTMVMVIFAAIVSGTSLRQYTHRLRSIVALGVGYGVVLWAVYFGIIMPLWARAVGIEGIPFPFFDLGFLVFHLGLGVVIGGVYYFTLRWFRGRGHANLNSMNPRQSS